MYELILLEQLPVVLFFFALLDCHSCGDVHYKKGEEEAFVVQDCLLDKLTGSPSLSSLRFKHKFVFNASQSKVFGSSTYKLINWSCYDQQDGTIAADAMAIFNIFQITLLRLGEGSKRPES